MKVAIKDKAGCYLASTSRHMGSQGGYGRCWSTDLADALKLSPADAEAVVDAEFNRYERHDLEIVVVGWL